MDAMVQLLLDSIAIILLWPTSVLYSLLSLCLVLIADVCDV
jgi:hypothetical protein